MKIIIFAPGGPDFEWDSRSIDQGIGGSEEAVCYLSRALVALGHDVFVHNRRQATLWDKDNVMWRPLHADMEGADVFVAWRDWRLWEKAPKGAKKYLWCHDIPCEPHWNPEALQHFDKIILLNEYHRKLYNVPPEKAFVCGNGADLTQFDQQVERIPGKCIYFSHPHRGLHQLREYWPKIREAVPHATLNAFWWQKEFLLPPNEALGIMPMRSLGHMELAREILSSDLLTYPSVFDPEIHPITCIKAQVGGAWPVTINKGGMTDTLLAGTFCSDPEHFIAYTIGLLTPPTEQYDKRLLREEREAMMKSARVKFDWRTIVRAWIDEFTSHDNHPQPWHDDAGLLPHE